MELRRELEDGVLTLTVDDGARNAYGPDDLDALVAAFDEAGDDVDAIVLAGNGEVFTAGLDVKYIQSATRDQVGALLGTLGRTVLRIWGEPRPTVAACTGHSLAAGTMLAMACDHAIAAEGEYRWGLSEVRIGFQLPHYGIELSRANVSSAALEDLLLPGAMVGPEQAMAVGFCDEVAPLDEVLERAQAHARALAQLPAAAYAGTKQRLRGDTIARLLATVDDDVAAVAATGPAGG